MTSREKILGLGMVAIFAAIALLFGYARVKDWRAAVERRAAAVELEEAEAETLLAEQELWNQRAAYLDRELPDYPGRGEAASGLLGSLEDSARAAGLVPSNQRIAELDPSPHYLSSTCEMQVAGSFTDVGRWIVSIQAGNPFREIRELRLIGNPKEKSKVTGTVLVVQYFKPEANS